MKNKPMTTKIIKNLIEHGSEKDLKSLIDQLELMGNKDICNYLGWPKDKVSAFYKRGTLPEPITSIGGRPVWLKKQIEPFKRGQDERNKKNE